MTRITPTPLSSRFDFRVLLDFFYRLYKFSLNILSGDIKADLIVIGIIIGIMVKTN
jgi:hypothetical protein